MAHSKLVLVSMTAAFLASGCTTTNTIVGANFTPSVEQAMNKQIVSSEAVKGAPILHPDMTAAAVDRYLSDEVKELEEDSGFGPGG